MCNLYSMTTNQQAIRELARAMRDMTGNERDGFVNLLQTDELSYQHC